MASTNEKNQVQGSKDVEWSKLCESCAAKKAIFMFSCSPFAEENSYGCIDPKCLNFYNPRNDGRSQNSTSDELLESQFIMLSHVHLNERKETEKLKQLLAIPFERMNQDQRSSIMAEIDHFYQEICKGPEEKSESPVSTSKGVCSFKDVGTSSNENDNY